MAHFKDDIATKKQNDKVTKTLQILFTLTLGLVLVFWIADIFLGIPAQLSDRSSTEGWFDDRPRYEIEKIKSLLLTLIYAIPTITLLSLTIKSIRQKNGRLFYWSFFIGLTIFQSLPVFGLFNTKGQAPTFIKPILITLFFILLIGQVYSIYQIKNDKSLKSKQ
jgi:hypothetical protein